MSHIKLSPSKQLILQVPIDQYEENLHFFRDILLLPLCQEQPETEVSNNKVSLGFGHITLILQSSEQVTAPRFQLVLETTDLQQTENYLIANNIPTLLSGTDYLLVEHSSGINTLVQGQKDQSS